MASRLVQAALERPGSGGVDAAREILKARPELPRRDFYAACVTGEAEAVASFVASSRDLARHPGGPLDWPPLHYVSHSRQSSNEDAVRAARTLLEAGANPGATIIWNTRDLSWELPPLVAAAGIVPNPSLVATLLQSGADPNDGHSVLRAALGGHVECLEALLEGGADLNAPCQPQSVPALHWLLDYHYSPEMVEWLLEHGAEVNRAAGPLGEAPIHVAVRRRRGPAVKLLLHHGAEIDQRTAGGRSAYAHALCRSFDELARLLESRGADTSLGRADRLASALIHDQPEAAKKLIEGDPDLVANLNPDQARIFPDLAAKGFTWALELLLERGADLAWRGLDGGTALHQAAWFGVPEAARFLIGRGAPLEIVCVDHRSTPLGWGAHGSRYSGGAEERQEVYVEIAEMLLQAGASLADPLHPDLDPQGTWLLRDASPRVAEVLKRHGAKAGEVEY